MKKTTKRKILLTGGGSGGPVSPLLAVYDYVKNLKEGDKFEFCFIGTHFGPEKKMVKDAGLSFVWIFCGKLNRFFTWRNLVSPFLTGVGFFQAIFFILKQKPDLVMSAGGFVSVPVAWAAFCLGVPILIHQQDIRSGLANKLMAPFAKKITVTFESSLNDYSKKSVWTGNPVRKNIKDLKKSNCSNFGFKKNMPLVLVLGGGTGALAINRLIKKSIDEMGEFCQVFHQTGKGKNIEIKHENYQCKEFLSSDEIANLMFEANVVISRCGLGTLTELSFLGKACILIPIPDSHQEDNAKIFKEKKAAKVFNQKDLNKDNFIFEVSKLMNNKEERNALEKRIKKIILKNASAKIFKEMNNIFIEK